MPPGEITSKKMGAKFVSRSVLGIFFATAIFVKGIESTDKIEDFPDYYPDYPDNIDPKGKETFDLCRSLDYLILFCVGVFI